MEKSFGVSHEVAILGISLFVEGLGTGPLLVGPLSELYGRNLVYRVSYLLFFAFTFPVAFASDAGKPLSLVVRHLTLRNAFVLSGVLGVPLHYWILRISVPERRRWKRGRSV
jgi:MFS family permease